MESGVLPVNSADELCSDGKEDLRSIRQEKANIIRVVVFSSNTDSITSSDISNFIGEYIGESAATTKKILEESQGNVLLIDEAYMLHPQRNRTTDCPFRQEVVDTLVGEV